MRKKFYIRMPNVKLLIIKTYFIHLNILSFSTTYLVKLMMTVLIKSQSAVSTSMIAWFILKYGSDMTFFILFCNLQD